MNESSIKDIVLLAETLDQEFSIKRDFLWKNVSILRTWGERDKCVRHILKLRWYLADGPEFDKFITNHSSERKRGAERWEE